jgi:hypothetical protein
MPDQPVSENQEEDDRGEEDGERDDVVGVPLPNLDPDRGDLTQAGKERIFQQEFLVQPLPLSGC